MKVKRAFLALGIVLLFSGCSLLRQLTGSQVRVLNDTDVALTSVSWGEELDVTNLEAHGATPYMTIKTKSATIEVRSADGLSLSSVWQIDFGGLYTLRVFTTSGSLGAEFIAEEGAASPL